MRRNAYLPRERVRRYQSSSKGLALLKRNRYNRQSQRLPVAVWRPLATTHHCGHCSAGWWHCRFTQLWQFIQSGQ
ncbi:MAG: hypothetical protein WD669_07455 [Pirellulales bacterium]